MLESKKSFRILVQLENSAIKATFHLMHFTFSPLFVLSTVRGWLVGRSRYIISKPCVVTSSNPTYDSQPPPGQLHEQREGGIRSQLIGQEREKAAIYLTKSVYILN